MKEGRTEGILGGVSRTDPEDFADKGGGCLQRERFVPSEFLATRKLERSKTQRFAQKVDVKQRKIILATLLCIP